MLRQGIGRRVRACAALGLFVFLAVAASAQAQLGDRTLKIGSKGRDVRAAQKALTAVGLKTTADGVYGSGTALHVKRWERTENRRADGKLQPADARALENAAADGQAGGDDPSTGNAADGTGGSSYATSGNNGAKTTMSPDGRTAIAPDSAPQQVRTPTRRATASPTSRTSTAAAPAAGTTRVTTAPPPSASCSTAAASPTSRWTRASSRASGSPVRASGSPSTRTADTRSWSSPASGSTPPATARTVRVGAPSRAPRPVTWCGTRQGSSSFSFKRCWRGSCLR